MSRAPEEAAGRLRCGHDDLMRELDLGRLPLANASLLTERLHEPEDRFPLELFLPAMRAGPDRLDRAARVAALELRQCVVLLRHQGWSAGLVRCEAASTTGADRARQSTYTAARYAGASSLCRATRGNGACRRPGSGKH